MKTKSAAKKRFVKDNIQLFGAIQMFDQQPALRGNFWTNAVAGKQQECFCHGRTFDNF